MDYFHRSSHLDHHGRLGTGSRADVSRVQTRKAVRKRVDSRVQKRAPSLFF